MIPGRSETHNKHDRYSTNWINKHLTCHLTACSPSLPVNQAAEGQSREKMVHGEVSDKAESELPSSQQSWYHHCSQQRQTDSSRAGRSVWVPAAWFPSITCRLCPRIIETPLHWFAIQQGLGFECCPWWLCRGWFTRDLKNQEYHF